MTAANKKDTEVEVLDQSDPNFLPMQYNLTEAAIAKLKEDYDPALIPDTEQKGDEGYLIVHEKAMAIVKVRTAIEAKRKELKADALSWGRLVDSKAKELTEIIEAIEEPWKKIKTDLDEKEAREAEEARQRELEAMKVIEEKVEQLKSATNDLVGKDVATLKERLATLSAVVIDESYGEYVEAAQFHKDTALTTLDSAIAERETFEEQQAQLKASQDALAAAQQEIDDKAAKVQKELDEKAAELEKIRLANEKEAADKMAEQQSKMDEQQASLDKQKAEQEAQEAAEKQRKEDEAFAELEEKQRKEKEAADAEAKKVRDAELYKRLPEDVKVRNYAEALLAVEVPLIEDQELKEVIIGAALNLGRLVAIVYENTQPASEDKKEALHLVETTNK